MGESVGIEVRETGKKEEKMGILKKEVGANGEVGESGEGEENREIGERGGRECGVGRKWEGRGEIGNTGERGGSEWRGGREWKGRRVNEDIGERMVR